MSERDAPADAPRDVVMAAYARIATGQRGGCCGSSCCGAADPGGYARGVGYSDDELGALPEGANMGLSCGNPTALASLNPGEVVLDLGCGGGLDVFLAVRRVGPTGRAIGVDMTPEMIARARRNAVRFCQETGLANVEFRLGEIECLPVPDESVDVVISNCVINLSPDKPRAWREIARVLRPGGRVAISDIALLEPLFHALRDSVEALVGCVGGAVQVEETRRMMVEAGLEDIVLVKRPGVVEAMISGAENLAPEVRAALPAGRKVGDYVIALDISACKGRRGSVQEGHE